MSKPWIHAKSSARKYGGKPEDYLEIHNFLDSSKGAIPSNIHRALTHTSWFLSNVLEKVFGVVMVNSDGKEFSVRSVGEQHVVEDLGFIPTPQDYFDGCEYKDWMHGRGVPPSMAHIVKNKNNKSPRLSESVGNLNPPDLAPPRPEPSLATKSDLDFMTSRELVSNTQMRD